MKWSDVKAWLHQGTTILGIAAIGGAVTSVLLDQATPKQAAAVCISGLISIAMKQVYGPTTVTGIGTTVNSDQTTVETPPGGTTTTKAP